MASLSEEQFLCSICLEVFTDPVSIPCGHNYCNTCITRHWVCTCPLCRRRFYSRPKLSVNKVLSERANPNQEPNLTIMYLIITLLVTLTLLFTHLFTKSVQIDYEGKEAELRKTDAEFQQMIQKRRVKIQEFKDSVELSKSVTDRDIADSEQGFAALTSFMRSSQAQFVGTERQAEGFIEELRLEMAELERRRSELLHLHLHRPLLNNFLSKDVPPPTRDWSKVRVRERPSYLTLRTVVETLRKESEEKWRDVALMTVQQYAVDETLDLEAAQRYSILPEDAKRVTFSHLQIVVGKRSFSSGRFYYEVQVGGKADWDLGVAREVINGHRPIALSPDSHWAIRMRNGSRCYAAADPDVILPVREELQTVGVFVDHEEGLVSFYDVETRVHLYSFTGCAFKEELYPYFSQYFTAGPRLLNICLFVISLCSFLFVISLCSFLIIISIMFIKYKNMTKREQDKVELFFLFLLLFALSASSRKR